MRHVGKSDKRKTKKGLESDGDSDLTQAHVSAASGDVAMLVQAIQQDPGVIQQRDGEGNTPLAHAVHGQHLNAVKRLVKMGADVNAQDSQGRTYLSIAAYQGWAEGVLYLLRKGAKHNIVDRSGRTPLHAATYDVDCRSVVALLKRLSVDDVNAADNEKMTALHWSAFHDRPDHVRHLLNKGADPLAQDVDGKTALHWAAQNGSRSCCTMLAEGDVTSVLLRSVDNTNKTVAHLAAAAGKAVIISDLAKRAPDLMEARDHDDRAPLHWSAAMGHANCVKVMLDLGVNPEPMDVEGTTPLQYARQAKHAQCVDLLEECLGIKQNHKNKAKVKRESSTAGDSKRSNKGFFKGLFGKKEKEKTNPDQQKTPEHLPKVSTNGKSQMTTSSATNGGHVETGSKTLTRDSTARDSKRLSGTSASDNHRTANGNVMCEETSANDQNEHRKKKKKHKRKLDREGDRLSSPSTCKTSSTWSEDKSTGDNYIAKLRNTHLSPLGNVNPPTISPVLPDPTQAPNLPLRRQGELSPLRINKPENGQKQSPVPSQLSKLKEMSKRTPTPPPQFSPRHPKHINTRKALPEISPLTQSMETLQVGRKKRKTKGDFLYAHAPEAQPSLPMLDEVESDVNSVENGRSSDKLSETSEREWGPELPRYPSDDAISLYKLRKSKHMNNETDFDD